MAANDISVNKKHNGVFQVAMSYAIWGILPLYWKTLKMIPSDQIIAHRIIWSFVFVAILLAVTKGFGNLRSTLKNGRDMVIITAAAILIAVNWYTYIWAVNSNHILESSMGYYINPLMSVLLGVAVLKEKLDIYSYIAFFMAAAGIIIITLKYGQIPWVALLMALTFALYGLLKKLVKASATIGLALETSILAPFAVAYILWTERVGTGALSKLPLPILLVLLCAGLVTATPLLLFASGAKNVELSTLGFLQYISPTISLFLGIFLYKEKFTAVEAVSFGLIWTGLLIFSLSRFEFFRKLVPLRSKYSMNQD